MNLPPSIEHAIRQQKKACNQTLNGYMYHLAPMHEKITKLRSIMPNGVDIFYAMKANPHLSFLKAAHDAGVAGIEIASLGEAKRAVAAGFFPNALIYTGPGKTPEELRWSVDHNIQTVHLESLTEAYRLEAIAAAAGVQQDVLLRINTNFDIHEAQTTFSGGSRKFGVDEEQLHTVLPALLTLPHLNFRGLHVYAASGVLNVDDLLKNCALVFSLTQEIERSYPNIHCDIIDFGGGFGIDYLEHGADFDPELWAKGLQALIVEYGFQGRHFVLELGRYLAADSGFFCTEIIDIKESRGKKQVVCAGGINHFRRPAALNINHPMSIVRLGIEKLFNAQISIHDEAVYFGGPLCTGADKLANNVHIEAADIGDIAVFGLAGAYGLSMSNIEFLSHKRADEWVISS
ncbi:MAG: alanine racemase [Mariprofundaceae bacterium]|nr:alanine racemase [Mariprofundaceae bacterium]